MYNDSLAKNISVVITAYNRPDYLLLSMESALNQTLAPNEIIIIDDHSPQDLSRVINEINTDTRVIYHRLNENSGANVARNKGVELSSSEYVAFLDDDDIWLPDKLKKQSDAIKGLTACLCAYEILENSKKHIKNCEYVYEDDLKQGNDYCGMSGLICRKDFLSKYPFDTNLPCGQDWDLFISIAKTEKIPYVTDSCFRYRTDSADSITTKQKTISVSSVKYRLQAADKHREWMGEDAYKERVAKAYLSYLNMKRNPLSFVCASIKYAGMSTTIKYLFKIIVKKIK